MSEMTRRGSGLAGLVLSVGWLLGAGPANAHDTPPEVRERETDAAWLADEALEDADQGEAATLREDVAQEVEAYQDPQQQAEEERRARKEEAQQQEAERREREEERRARQEERRQEARDRREEAQEREEELYDRGTDAIDDGEWEEAIKAFDQAAALKGRRAPACLYWKAYAWNKRGMRIEALNALGELRGRYPQSRWRKEAEALEIEIRGRSGEATQPENVVDEDLKLMALNGLLSSDPERAVPLLERFLEARHSAKLQDRALFVLAQSGSPRARDILARTAMGQVHPELQAKALRYLGMFGGRENRDVLAGVYEGSGDHAVKKAVLNAYMLCGERTAVLAVSRGEKDPELRREAVRTLGLMGARMELWEMFLSSPTPEDRGPVLEALFLAGDSDHVLEAARTSKDVATRIEAIRRLGLMGSRTADSLLGFYRGEKEPKVREAVLQALFLQGNARALVEIARTEKDPELKRKAVSHLSHMGSKEATDFMLELLEK